MQDSGYYEAWERRYQEAEIDMLAREERLEALVEEIERKLTLVGASGAASLRSTHPSEHC